MNNKEQNTSLGCIGAITVVVFVLVVGSFLNGWALSLLWRWFVVSAIGLPELSIVHALGIGLIVQFLTSDLEKQKTKSDAAKWEAAIYACVVTIAKPFMYLAMGWIYLQFMRG